MLLVARFLFWIAETGRIPVDNPSSSQELSLIDPARTFAASGPDLALYAWGGWMKFTVIGVNVLGTPWGLAATMRPLALAGAVLTTVAKLLLVGTLLVALEAPFAKLRLLRIPEFLSVAALVALVAVVAATRRA